MSLPTSLALVWHQHQPYYPDDVSGETLMPWVRLHATKDYLGMALHLAEVPEFHCTINLVPSLLVQLRRYVDGGGDRHLDVSRMPADSLSEEEVVYLLEHFFMANHETMIRPYPRYRELLQRRGNAKSDPAQHAAQRFSTTDLRDLQIWNNLTWIHELVFERDTELSDFRRRGRGWSEADKQWLLKRQRELVAEVIPLHRKLSEAGQVELTTTPFYHPILPLLWDKRSARQAMPGCELPRHLDRYPDDVSRHLQRAVEYHTELFGSAPRGMWPSEGSVSQEIIAAIADVGIQWIATDEEILTQSLDGAVGHAQQPEKLYQPWQVEQQDRTLQVVFRDHALSDQIGFHYQRADPQWAADDLLNRVAAIGQSVALRSPNQPAIVPIILDGENCWEHYQDGGVSFLRRLYREGARRQELRPVRVAEHLEAHPAVDRIPQLFAGSWIYHNFAIWIGHHEDRTAWDALHETRRFLIQAEQAGRISADQLQLAWKELDIAEGSDWFWWYGDDHSSDLDSLFDQLFRRHLENVYRLLGEAPPTSLARPIGGNKPRVLHSMPRGFMEVRIDGEQTSFFEWTGAGLYEAGSERGSMTMVSDGLVRQVLFGFDSRNLFVRIDTAADARQTLRDCDNLRLRFVEPQETELVVSGWKTGELHSTLRRHGEEQSLEGRRAVARRVVELAIPFELLEVKPGESLGFFVELFAGGQSIDRTPQEGTIDLRVPNGEFESLNWQA
ncbi:MAG: alpha-amylase/alpha-mannosidase [Planctomycetaceae bacterium]